MKRITIDWLRRTGEGRYMVADFKTPGSTGAQRRAMWLDERTRGLGGSDMATVMGLNPRKTPYDLWLEKTGKAEPADISSKWAVERGNALEAVLRRRFARQHPDWMVWDGTDRTFESVQHPFMHASLDGVIRDQDGRLGVLEIKTAGWRRAADWRDQDGTLMAPAYYMAQVAHYMAVTGFDWGCFYADLGESEPVEVRFERDEADVKAVTDAAETFWKFVTEGTPPALTGSDVDAIQATPPYPEGWEDAGADTDMLDKAASDWARADMAEKSARKAKAAAADLVKMLVGDQREGIASPTWRAGYQTIHYKAQPARPAKDAYDVRRFTIKPTNTKQTK